jgi:hypothetical protein
VNAIQRFQFVTIATLVALFSGCNWHSLWPQAPSLPSSPIVFHQTPSTTDVIAYLNNQASLVHSIQSEGASVTVPGYPALNQTELFMQPTKRIRLRAATAFTGQEMDLGSNEEMFWIWIKRNTPKGVYYAEHNQFVNSPLRQMFPVDPSWIGEAFGIVTIDPAAEIQGPTPKGTNQIEIRIAANVGGQSVTKAIVLHSTYGWVMEQHIYTQNGQLLASAIASNHQYYGLGQAGQGVNLPHQVMLQVPSAQMNLQINIQQYAVNLPFAGSDSIWQMPQPAGYPLVDISSPNAMQLFMPAGNNGRVPTPVNQFNNQQPLPNTTFQNQGLQNQGLQGPGLQGPGLQGQPNQGFPVQGFPNQSSPAFQQTERPKYRGYTR